MNLSTLQRGSQPSAALLLCLATLWTASTSCSSGGKSSSTAKQAPPTESQLSTEVEGPSGPVLEQEGLYLLEVAVGDSLATTIRGHHADGSGQTLSVELASGDPAALGFSDLFPIVMDAGSIDPSITIGAVDLASSEGSVVFVITGVDDANPLDVLSQSLEVRVVAPSAQGLAGQWSFFRRGTACDQDEFAWFPLSIQEAAGGSFSLVFGQVGEQFAFTGLPTGVPNQFSLAGTSAVDGTVMIVVEGLWSLSADGNQLGGTMTVERTEAGGTECLVVDEIEAYRQDDTSSSAVLGIWELTTAAQADGCDRQAGEVQVIEGELLPKRENGYVLNLSVENDVQLQFDAQREGSLLTISGMDEANAESATMLAGSELEYSAAGERLTGHFSVELESEGSSCTMELGIVGLRRPTGGRYFPYLEDTFGAQRLLGVDSLGSFDPVELVGHLGATQFVDVPKPLNYAATVHELRFDDSHGLIYEEGPETLYFATAEGLYSLDLLQRLDAFGQPAAREPVLIEPDAAGAWWLSATPLLGEYKAVLVLRGLTGSEYGVCEVHRSGAVTTTRLEALHVPIVSVDPDTGEYRGLVFSDSQGGMSRVYKGELTSLHPANVIVLARASNGIVYFTTSPYAADTGLWRFDPRTESVEPVDQAGQFLPLTVRGTTAYYARAELDDLSHVRVFRLEQDGSPYQVMELFDVKAGTSAFLGARLRIVRTESRIVVQYIKQGTSEVRTVSAHHFGTEFMELDPQLATVDLQYDLVGTMDDNLFVNDASGRALMFAADAPTSEVLDNSRWLAPVPESSYYLAAPRRSFSMLLANGDPAHGANGSLGAVDAGPAPLAAIRGLMSAEGNPSFGVSIYGQDLIVQHDPLGASDVYYAKASEGNSSLRMTYTPGEYDSRID